MRQTGKCQMQWNPNMTPKRRWREAAVPFGPLLFARSSSRCCFRLWVQAHRGFSAKSIFFSLHYTIYIPSNSHLGQVCGNIAGQQACHCFGKLSMHNRAPSAYEAEVSHFCAFLSTFWLLSKNKMLNLIWDSLLLTLRPKLDCGSEQFGISKLMWLSPCVPFGSSFWSAWLCYRGANYSELVWDECEHLVNICFSPAAANSFFLRSSTSVLIFCHVIKQPTCGAKRAALWLFIFQIGFLIPVIKS